MQRDTMPADNDGIIAEVREALRANRTELENIGVLRVDIFGSMARGENGIDSDMDLIVDLDAEVVRDLFQLNRVCRVLQELIRRPVDIVERSNIREDLKPAIFQDAINVFRRHG